MSRLRHAGFVLADAVKGMPMGMHMKRLHSAFADEAMARSYRELLLSKLISHALSEVPYYSQFAGAKSLQDFPVLQKRTVQDRYADFLSKGFSTSMYVEKNTSGSYGTPITFRLTRDQVSKTSAELVFFNRWAGYYPGMRHIYFSHVKQAGLRTFVQNETVIYPGRMGEAWLQDTVQKIRQPGIEFVIAAPSVLANIWHYCLHNRVSLKGLLKGIIIISEPCPEELRHDLMFFFGCPVHGRYACTEFGVIAHQCLETYHVNPLEHIVEILDIDTDGPCKPGVPGRVVVTGLSNMAMPLIRYDTGDLAIRGEECICGRKGMTLTAVIGRQVEKIYATHGDSVLPFVLWSRIQYFPGILQYQFVQSSQMDYELRLRVAPGFAHFADCEVALRALLGEDARVVAREVHEIESLPSGKRPLVINSWKKSDGR